MKKNYDYSETVLLKHNELAATVNQEEQVELTGDCVHTVEANMKIMINNTSDLELVAFTRLYLDMNIENKTKIKSTFTIEELMTYLRVSKNKTKSVLKRLVDLHLLLLINEDYYVNPYVCIHQNYTHTENINKLCLQSVYYSKEIEDALFKLKITNKNKPNKKHNIYVLEMIVDGIKYYKLGYSKSIQNRLKQYEAHNPFIKLWQSYYIKDAIVIEKEIHSKHKSIYKNEWYDETTIKEITANYFD